MDIYYVSGRHSLSFRGYFPIKICIMQFMSSKEKQKKHFFKMSRLPFLSYGYIKYTRMQQRSNCKKLHFLKAT